MDNIQPLTFSNGHRGPQDLLLDKIHVGYFAIMKATRIFFVTFALLSLLHFLAPANSFAGQALAVFTQSPYVITGFIYVITGLGSIYYYRLGKTIQLHIDGGRLTLQSGHLITKQVILDLHNINHVSIERSVFERIYSLSSLKVFTAGNQKETIALPNLHASCVAQIRELLQPSE